MTDWEKWMILPKFKVEVLDNPQLGKFITIKYGDLKNPTDIISGCIEYTKVIEELALAIESSLNGLLKTYHIGANKGEG